MTCHIFASTLAWASFAWTRSRTQTAGLQWQLAQGLGFRVSKGGGDLLN